MGNPATGHFV